MKVTGIVVEYNPFHNGHKYHIEKVKELTNPDIIVAVMSGNFVQRGQPAIIDKWARTKAAIENGVDVVLELPTIFTLQSATQFGKNAIDILALAKVDSVVFGSETNNLEELTDTANLSFNIDNFKENMAKGFSYPAAYGFMADSYGPNDILAISYLRELANFPNIQPISILRTSDYLNDELDEKLPSALAIRTSLLKNEAVDNYTCMASQLKDYDFPTMEKYYPYIRSLLLTTPTSELSKIFLMDEGIENLMCKQAYKCFNYHDFLNGCVTRRYTKARIQRTLCHLMLNNTKEMVKKLPEYDTIRVLGFSEKGKAYLNYLQENDVKVANHFTANLKPYRDIEYKAAVIYSMNMNEEDKEYINRAEIAGLNL